MLSILSKPRKANSLPLSALIAVCLVINVLLLLHGNAGVHTIQLHLHSSSHKDAAPLVLGASQDSVPASQPGRDKTAQQDLRKPALKYDMRKWLQIAAADAARHSTHISGSCNASHGLGFLEEFRLSTGNLCGPQTERHASSVECSAYPVEHRGLACWATNIVINASGLLGAEVPPGFQEHSKYLPAGLAGSVKFNCHMQQPTDTPAGTRTVWQSGAGDSLKGELLPWFKPPTAVHDADAVETYCGRSDSVDHPVMFVVRLDPTNPYHHTQVQRQRQLGPKCHLSTCKDGL